MWVKLPCAVLVASLSSAVSLSRETDSGLDVAVNVGGDGSLALQGQQQLAGDASGGLFKKGPTTEELLAKLDGLVGLESVKEKMRTLAQGVEYEKMRKKAGIDDLGSQSYHMLFLGNPGTGKTMVARIVGEILLSLGALKVPEGNEDKPPPFLEVVRQDLVGEKSGETAIKTNAVVSKALGGVLFVDEAYSLVHDRKDTIGREAFDTLMKLMEDKRDQLVVIFAGYSDNMREFIQQNPGMRSRVPASFDFVFQDYTCPQLMRISASFIEKKKATIEGGPCPELDNYGVGASPACTALRSVVKEATQCCESNSDPDCRPVKDNGNGRTVRNLLEKTYRKLARRVLKTYGPDAMKGWAEKAKTFKPFLKKPLDCDSGSVYRSHAGTLEFAPGNTSTGVRFPDWEALTRSGLKNPEMMDLRCALAELRAEDFKKDDDGDDPIPEEDSLLETESAALLETESAALLETESAALVETESAALVETESAALVETETPTMTDVGCRMCATLGPQWVKKAKKYVDRYGHYRMNVLVAGNANASRQEVVAAREACEKENSPAFCKRAAEYVTASLDESFHRSPDKLATAPGGKTFCTYQVLNCGKLSTFKVNRLTRWQGPFTRTGCVCDRQNTVPFRTSAGGLKDLENEPPESRPRSRIPGAGRAGRPTPGKARPTPGKAGGRPTPGKVGGRPPRPGHLAPPRGHRDVDEFLKFAGQSKFMGSKARMNLEELQRKGANEKVEKLLEELRAMVGLAEVKESISELRDLVELNYWRKKLLCEDPECSLLGQSLHMQFLGNPGTGKTHVARVLGKILVSLGVLNQEAGAEFVFHEVDRSMLVGEYMGTTAPKVEKAFAKAKGGVLFIDEAYSLVKKESSRDPFGHEAVDAIIKLMEEKRDETIVILAGYDEEMATFIDSNPGFKSRLPFTFNFADYTCEELGELAGVFLGKEQLSVAEGAQPALDRTIRVSTECCSAEAVEKDGCVAPRDNGNGRSVRNVLEAATRSMSRRVVDEMTPEKKAALKACGKANPRKKKKEASPPKQKRPPAPALREGTACPSVELTKDYRKYTSVKYWDEDIGTTKMWSNSFITEVLGNGKYTLDNKKTVSYTHLRPSNFLEPHSRVKYCSNSYKKWLDARVDEQHGHASVSSVTLNVKKGVWLKGKTELFDKILPIDLSFPPDENASFVEVADEVSEEDPPPACASEVTSVAAADFREPSSTAAAARLRAALQAELARPQGGTAWWDAQKARLQGAVALCVPAALQVLDWSDGDFAAYIAAAKRGDALGQAASLAAAPDAEAAGLSLAPAASLAEQHGKPKLAAEFRKLDELIGLAEVKSNVATLFKSVLFNSYRELANLDKLSAQSFHMKFLGNPGTGKTVVARSISALLNEMGVIEGKKKEAPFVEADRSALVGEWVGQTAPKVAKLVESAVGGVLFIDEAYTLVNGNQDSFGREAVDTLIKLMEDRRKEVVVILAGYERQMADFIDANPGFKSRVPFSFLFEDYSCTELSAMASLQCGYKSLTVAAKPELDRLLKFTTGCCDKPPCPEGTGKDKGNGRAVRNVIEDAARRLAKRVVSDKKAFAAKSKSEQKKELTTLRAEDFDAAFADTAQAQLGYFCEEHGAFDDMAAALGDHDLGVARADRLPVPAEFAEKISQIMELTKQPPKGTEDLIKTCEKKSSAALKALKAFLPAACGDGEHSLQSFLALLRRYAQHEDEAKRRRGVKLAVRYLTPLKADVSLALDLADAVGKKAWGADCPAQLAAAERLELPVELSRLPNY